jgi:hypothetical protein
MARVLVFCIKKNEGFYRIGRSFSSLHPRISHLMNSCIIHPESRDGLSLLFEDDSMIVVDKAANMLSVPGKDAKPFTKFRCDEWQEAIQLAGKTDFEVADSECKRVILHLATNGSVPRKEGRFYSFLFKSLKIDDQTLQKSIWKCIYDADIQLNSQKFENIPKHLVSTADLVERHCGHKIYTVHR